MADTKPATPVSRTPAADTKFHSDGGTKSPPQSRGSKAAMPDGVRMAKPEEVKTRRPLPAASSSN